MANLRIDNPIEEKARIEALVRAAQSGDRLAFGELYERYERHVFGLAMKRLGNYAEAQELCQDVFIQAMRKIGQLQEPAAFGGWLRSITHRMAINRLVRRRPELPTEPDIIESAYAHSEKTPLDAVLEDERRTELRAGMDRLGDLDRETLEAFYVHGRSLLEMSDEFDAPLGTIKRRLHMARKRLAKKVEALVAV